MGYSKDGPCRKFTSFFFRVKKFKFSLEKDFGVKNRVEKNKNKKIKQFLFFFFITVAVRTFKKFYFSECEL